MTRLLRLWRIGADDWRLVWYALRHPERPAWLLPVVAILAVYALEPLNFAVPFLGVVDDLVLVPLGLHLLLKLLPPTIRAGFAARSRPRH
jgi:uncharacterized membrane protein YkvA (DUF1232 family)